jgi:hypothetical protein
LCQFKKLPEIFLSEYKSTKNESYGTPNFIEGHRSSSTLVAPEKGCIDLSMLNFGYLETNNQTCEWKIGDQLDELRERLCKHIFNGDRDSFNQFVDVEVTNLEAVQQLLYAKSYECISDSIDELQYLQPLVTLMEADFVERIQAHPSFKCPQMVELIAGQGFQLVAKAKVTTAKHVQKEFILKGTSDLLIIE